MTVVRSPVRPVLRSPVYNPLVGRFGRFGAGTSAGALLGDDEESGFALSFEQATADALVRWPDNTAKQFSGDPNDLLTYTSPSTKYVMNENGILVPGTTLRTDHDASGNALGLLIEEQRTNLFLNSDSAANQTITISATGDYTLTVWGAGSVAVAANTATGTGFGTATDGSPVTFNISGTGTIDCTVTGSPDFVNVEKGSFGTSPILTAGSQVTRNTDNISLATTEFPYDDAVGTWIVHLRLKTVSQLQAIFYGSGSNAPMFINSAGNLRMNDGTNITAIGNLTVDTKHKAAIAASGSTTSASLDGGAITNGTFDGGFGVSTLGIGTVAGGGSPFNGHIEAAIYLPRHPSDADLQARTA